MKSESKSVGEGDVLGDVRDRSGVPPSQKRAESYRTMTLRFQPPTARRAVTPLFPALALGVALAPCPHHNPEGKVSSLAQPWGESAFISKTRFRSNEGKALKCTKRPMSQTGSWNGSRRRTGDGYVNIALLKRSLRSFRTSNECRFGPKRNQPVTNDNLLEIEFARKEGWRQKRHPIWGFDSISFLGSM